ncbi:hypothetical protein [Sporomusa sp.]|uniref:hypothetical protein n=1 Tax=Sporomusa sp. TaxID=2078658 RepID=UPI002BCD0B62|nr:hypothetical protein [Sporomusa sp.]HWR05274.1 hypothetical protein [Sporomusa sp.]
MQNAASRTAELSELSGAVTQEMQVLNQNAQAIGTAAEKGQTAIHRATEVIQGIADTTQTKCRPGRQPEYKIAAGNQL